MALRILLADESSTIKKAIQLALAEYGPEIKSVTSGLDVMSVAKNFMPHVVLADVLLTQKNGYEVCYELKNNPATQDIPVILMWSSFLQLDQKEYNRVKANSSLEKPFDTNTIQNVFHGLIPDLNSHPLKGFTNHVNLPDFEDSDTFVRQKNIYNLNQIKNQPIQADEEEHTQSLQIPEEPLEPPPTVNDNSNQDADHWSSQNGPQIQIETENFGEFEEVTSVSSVSNLNTNVKSQVNSQIQNYLKDSTVASHNSKEILSSQKLSNFEEQLLKEEIRQMAEKICWQVIPELTEKIVREEITKLIREIETTT